MKKILLMAILALMVQACKPSSDNNQDNKDDNTSKTDNGKENTDGVSKNVAYVNPPFKEEDVIFEDFVVKAEDGKNITTNSGSMINFPKNAFLDAEGKEIKGEVSVKYREIMNPADIFLSGISMKYDSSGTKNEFQSAGMIEILAFHQGKPVFVNPKAKGDVLLKSDDLSKDYNLYHLDTVKRNWTYLGKDEIKNMPSKAQNNANENVAVAPIKPEKANPDKLTFDINSPDIPELNVYKGVKFEVLSDADVKKMEANAKITWEKAYVERTRTPNVYNIVFIAGTNKQQVLAKPVLGEKDFAAAYSLFEKKNEAYKKAIEEGLKIDVATEKQARAFSIANFGTINCDRMRSEQLESVDIIAKNAQGQNLMLKSVSIVQKGINGVLNYDSPKGVRYAPTQDNFICGITENGNFVHARLPKTEGKTSVEVKMAQAEAKDIRKLMKF